MVDLEKDTRLTKRKGAESQNSITKEKSNLTRKEQYLRFIDSTPVTSFMTIVTIYALYSDDVRILAFDKSWDEAFVVLSSIAFFLFIIEIAIQGWCRDKYLALPNLKKIQSSCQTANELQKRIRVIRSSLMIGSFYFWLDSLATISMVLEIPWLSPFDSDVNNSSLENARAGKASRAGAKAARILKVVRMIRLVKLYKYFSENKNKKDSGSVVPDTDDESLDNMPLESHVGAEMSDRTTKKVIVGILIMLMVIPILQPEDLEYNDAFGMQMVLARQFSDHSKLLQNQNATSEIFGEQITLLTDSSIEKTSFEGTFEEKYFLRTTNCIELVYRGFDNHQYVSAMIPFDRPSPESLRKEEKRTITITGEDDKYSIKASFDDTKKAEEEALLNFFLTTFVIMLLAVGTMTFSRDVNSLVIIPIEKMVLLVREISTNPLGKNFSLTPSEIKELDDGMETTLLLNTISKIAGLMRVGFGEAGAEIIGRNLNMSSDEHGGSSMNLLGNGTKIKSIFGFCDIRNFTDTTECLQEEVMLFVNRIAHILHSIVVQCDGAANKNIGDAFLLTWKISSKSQLESCESHNFSGDKALYSFLKTMVEMIKHEDFICNFSPTALGALYERMPGYKCRIGCGLHFGWAVEGAIGSDKKIDASYISPHVNMSEFLESSTKQYNVPILMSEPFFNLLSPQVSKYCRQIDRIKKTKNDQVTGIFTYDALLDSEFFKTNQTKSAPQINLNRKSRHRNTNRNFTQSKHRRSRHTAETSIHSKKRIQSSGIGILGEAPEIVLPKFCIDVWDMDEDVVNLRIHFKEETRKAWELGFKSVIEGDWGAAVSHLNEVLEATDGRDGPSQFLMKKMEKFGFKAPNDWNGYFEL